MPEPLTLLADSFIGRHLEVTLEKRDGDTAWMRLQIWNSSLDFRRDDPTKDDVINLYDVRFDKARRLLFKGKMNGSYPLITVGLNPAVPAEDRKAFIRVVVVDSFGYLADASVDYTLENDNYAALFQFLLDCDFPDIEASVIRNEKAVVKAGFSGAMSGADKR
jgi:hypothetical protein